MQDWIGTRVLGKNSVSGVDVVSACNDRSMGSATLSEVLPQERASPFTRAKFEESAHHLKNEDVGDFLMRVRFISP